MAKRDSHLQEVLDGYARFLREKNLALDKHQPHLVRWVREFLFFARAHAGYSFEQTLDLFLAEVGGVWVRSRGSFSRRRTRYASTVINTAEPRQGRTVRPQRRPSWTMPRGWSGCARSSACATTPAARRRPTCTGTAVSWRIATKPGRKASRPRPTPRRNQPQIETVLAARPVMQTTAAR